METQFYIIYNFKTTEGWESFARFFIGDDREEAVELFGSLQGTTESDEHSPLSIDFMETINGLPVNLKMLYCNLLQLGENTKIITKELFKRHAFNE